MSYVYFDITIGGTEVGKVVMMLYDLEVPKTVHNFKCLCTSVMGNGKTTGKALSYAGSIFHRVIPGNQISHTSILMSV